MKPLMMKYGKKTTACRRLIVRTLVYTSVCAAYPAWAQDTTLNSTRLSTRYDITNHRLTQESFLHRRSYLAPLDQRAFNSKQKNYSRSSTGSLSNSQFYFSHQLQLIKELGRYASLYYQQEDNSFVYARPIAQEAGLRLFPRFHFNIFGFPSASKTSASQGVGIGYGEPYQPIFFESGILTELLLFNVENRQSLLITPQPRKTHLRGHLQTKSWWLEGKFEQQRHTTLLDLGESWQRSHEGWRGQFELDWRSSSDWLVGGTWEGFLEHRSEQNVRNVASDRLRRQQMHLRIGDIYLGHIEPKGDVWELGLSQGVFSNLIHRRANLDAEENVYFDYTHKADQRYVVFKKQVSPGIQWLFSLFSGDVLTRQYLADSSTPKSEKPTDEIKLGVGTLLIKADSHRLLFNTTWDLDLQEGRQWDGGNIQLEMFF